MEMSEPEAELFEGLVHAHRRPAYLERRILVGLGIRE